MQLSPTLDQLKVLHRWRLSTFSVCLFGYIGYYLCRKNISAAFPLMSEAFGYSNTQLGLIAFYSELAYAAGKFINGPLADKIGGRKIFLTGMAGAIVFNLVFSQMNTLTGFIIVWCVARYFLSMGWGGLAKTIGHWYEPERNGTIMGIISINFQFGGVLAAWFAALLVSMGVGWQGVFIYPAIVLTFILIWSWAASRETPQDVYPNIKFPDSTKQPALVSTEQNEGKPLEIIKSLLKLNFFRHLLAYSFLTTFLRSIFFFWTPKILTDMGQSTSTAIFNSAIFPLLGCFGTIFLGWYTDKHAKDGNRAKMMWIMLTGLTICLSYISFEMNRAQPDTILIVGFLGLSGFFLLGPYSMTSGCLTLDIAGGKAAGSATGLIDGIGYIGGALAVWLAGYISDEFSWSNVFALLTFCALLSTLSAFYMSYKQSHKGNQL